MLIARLEGAPYGVRSNAVGPAATTRMDGADVADASSADYHDPADVSPVVAWLAAADCPANGRLLHVYGNRVMVLEPAAVAADLRTSGRWTLDQLDEALPSRLVEPRPVADFLS